jgi:putative NADH-flavin reductase
MSAGALAVLGATRGVGLATVQRALGERMTVRAVVRPTTDPTSLPSGVTPCPGDVRDPGFLREALNGCATVAVCLGLSPTQRPVTLFSDTVRALLALATPPRILLVTGLGAGDSRGHGGFLYDRLLNPLFLRTIYADKNRAEALLEQHPSDWLVVRPGFLTNEPETGRYRILTDLTGVRCGKISRADVAHFLVSETLSPKRRRLAVLLTY